MGGFFCWKKYSLADEKLSISKIEIGKNEKDEFIELYNPTEKDIDLEKLPLFLHILNSSGKDTNKKLTFSEKTIKSHGYFLIAANSYVGTALPLATYSPSGNTLVKNGAVYISTSSDKDIGVLDYVYCTEGYPHKKIEEEEIIPIKYSDKIQITELLPNPASDATEYIELYNNSTEKIELENWSLHDASKSGEYVFSSKDEIESKKYLAVYKELFKFSLNNGGDEKITLYDPNKKIVFEVEYKGSKKGLSYNFNGLNWHWSQFLTPGKENIFEKIPVGKLKIDDSIYENVYANFEVTGLSKKAKIKWDFGDGHGSSLAKTRHKYLKTGTYGASVKYSEGSDDVVKNFEVIVEKIRHPKVEIVAINANPVGSDTESETITLQNKSKSKINLLGWSIATGWKKLINHPVTEDLEIKKGQKKEVTREFSKFTLNNKKSEIELRYPDGEVASSLKYNKKDGGIAEGEIYQKIKSKKWEWVLQKNNKLPETQSAAEKISPDEIKKPEEMNVPLEDSTQKNVTQPEENLDSLVGKFSQRKNLKQEVEAKILGFRDSKISSGFTRKFASLDQGFVLGVSTSKINRFEPKEDKLPTKYLYKANLFLNQFILKFQR